jgi:hypothetical protein
MKAHRHVRLVVTDPFHPVASSTVVALRGGCSGGVVLGVAPGAGERPPPPGLDRVVALHNVDATEFESGLRALVSREGIEVILPWTDRDALALSALGDRFEGAALVCPRRSLVELAGDKWATIVGIRELGVPVPAARVIATGADLRRAAGELGYPARSLVLKPRSLSGARGVWSLRADADPFAAGPLPQANVEAMAVLVDACREQRTDSFVLQEEVPGEDVSVDVLAAAGTVEMAAARTRTATLGGLCIEVSFARRLKPSEP